MNRFIAGLALLLLPFVGLSQTTKWSSTTLTRPANSTTYAANDVITDSTQAILVFSSIARVDSGTFYITTARLAADTANAANALFRLYLYHDSTGISLPADNAALPLLEANHTLSMGYIDFDTLKTGGTGSTAASIIQTDLNIPGRTLKGKNRIYGVLMARAAYVPELSGTFYIELVAEQTK